MNFLFNSWSSLGRTVVVALLAYAGLLLILRVSGKRTLSKMNAFDLVVTVALGSTLATIILSRDVALTDGLLAFALLVGMQFVITWLSVRSSRVAQVVKGEPRLLFYRGQFLAEAMRHERVTEGEMRAAVRQQGVAELGQVGAIVLETDGSVTVVPDPGVAGERSALQGVAGFPAEHG